MTSEAETTSKAADPFLADLPARPEEGGEDKPALQNFGKTIFMVPELDQFVEQVSQRARDGMNTICKAPKNSGFERLLPLIEMRLRTQKIETTKTARMFQQPMTFLKHLLQHHYRVWKIPKGDQIALSGSNPDPLYEACVSCFAARRVVFLIEEPIERGTKAAKTIDTMLKLCERTGIRFVMNYETTIDDDGLRKKLLAAVNRVNFPRLSATKMRDYVIGLIAYEEAHPTPMPTIKPEYRKNQAYLKKLVRASAPYVGWVYHHAQQPPLEFLRTSRWNYPALESKGDLVVPTFELKWPLIYISSFAIIARGVHQSAQNVDKLIIYGPLFTLAVILFFSLRNIHNDDYAKRKTSHD